MAKMREFQLTRMSGGGKALIDGEHVVFVEGDESITLIELKSGRSINVLADYASVKDWLEGSPA